MKLNEKEKFNIKAKFISLTLIIILAIVYPLFWVAVILLVWLDFISPVIEYRKNRKWRKIINEKARNKN